MTAHPNSVTDSRKVIHPIGTTYIVFALVTVGEGDWKRVGARKARDAQTAIRETVKTLATDDQEGTFAAVPERSWTALKIKPRVVTEYDVEEVS